MKDLLSAFKGGSYELMEPWRASEKSLTLVVPIVSKKKTSRAYFVLEEVQDKVKMIDSGGIHGVYVESKVDRPTFIRGGTMLKGATQERATQFGFVVMPGKPETIMVHCIHASRGIHAGASFLSSGYAPARVYSSMLSKRSQRETWEEVNRYCFELHSPNISETRHYSSARHFDPQAMRMRMDDLVGTVEKLQGFRKDLDEILKKIPDYVDQVGAVIVDPDGVVGLEMYDHPDSWKAFSKSIMKSYSEELTKEDKTGIFKPDMEATVAAVKNFLEGIERFEEEQVFGKGKCKTMVLKTKGYVGEYTTIDERTIHLLVTRGEMQEPLPQRIQPIQRQPESKSPSTIQRLVNWGKRKMRKGTQVVESLQKSPKTWTSLRLEIPMSKATLSSRLKELQESGVVEKSKGTNGVTRYSLTGIGQEVLHEPPDIRQMIREGDQKIAQLRSCVQISETRTSEIEQEEACPGCGSRNLSVWGFGRKAVSYECNECRHKWTAPRELRLDQ